MSLITNSDVEVLNYLCCVISDIHLLRYPLFKWLFNNRSHNVNEKLSWNSVQVPHLWQVLEDVHMPIFCESYHGFHRQVFEVWHMASNDLVVLYRFLKVKVKVKNCEKLRCCTEKK
jgi:hypothetical protein